MGCGIHRRSEAVPSRSLLPPVPLRSHGRCPGAVHACPVCHIPRRHSRTVSAGCVMLMVVFTVGFFGSTQAIDTRNPGEISSTKAQDSLKDHDEILPHLSQSHHRHLQEQPHRHRHRHAAEAQTAAEHSQLVGSTNRHHSWESNQYKEERKREEYQNTTGAINSSYHRQTQLEEGKGSAEQLQQVYQQNQNRLVDTGQVLSGDSARTLHSRWPQPQIKPVPNYPQRQRRHQRNTQNKKEEQLQEELRQQELQKGWLLYQRYRRRQDFERQRQLKETQRRATWEADQQRLYRQWVRLQSRLYHQLTHHDDGREERGQLSSFGDQNHQSLAIPNPHRIKQNRTGKDSIDTNLEQSSDSYKPSSGSNLGSSTTSTGNDYLDLVGYPHSKKESTDEESHKKLEHDLIFRGNHRGKSPYSRQRSTKSKKFGVEISEQGLEHLSVNSGLVNPGNKSSQRHPIGRSDSWSENNNLESMENLVRNLGNEQRKHKSDFSFGSNLAVEDTVVKVYRLVNSCSEKYVKMTVKRLDASATKNNPYSKLKIVAHWPGIVTIQSAASHSLLCFNKHGRLKITQRFSKRIKNLCLFRESYEENASIKFQSYERPDWFIGFRKNGRPLRGNTIHRQSDAANKRNSQYLQNQPFNSNTSASRLDKIDESSEARKWKESTPAQDTNAHSGRRIIDRHLRIKAEPIPFDDLMQAGDPSGAKVYDNYQNSRFASSNTDVISPRRRRSTKNKKKRVNQKCYQFMKRLVEEPNQDPGPNMGSILGIPFSDADGNQPDEPT